MFCFHEYGKVESDGYQYCRKCGKARKVECNHTWEIIEKWNRGVSTATSFVSKIYILRCKKCGEITNKELY